MRIKPLHDWAVIKRTGEGEMTAGGIIIPGVAREKSAEGIVEAIGPGKFIAAGKGGKKERFVPTTVKPGQRVAFVNYMAKDLEIDGAEVTLVREEDMLGTYEEAGYPAVKESHRLLVREELPPPSVRKKQRNALVPAGGAQAASGRTGEKTVKKQGKVLKTKEAGPAERGPKKGEGAGKNKMEATERETAAKTAGKSKKKVDPQRGGKTTSPKRVPEKRAGGKALVSERHSVKRKGAEKTKRTKK